MVEAMDEQERYRIRQQYDYSDKSPFVERILGIRDIGEIIVEGLLDAGNELRVWAAQKIINAANVVGEAQDVENDD